MGTRAICRSWLVTGPWVGRTFVVVWSGAKLRMELQEGLSASGGDYVDSLCRSATGVDGDGDKQLPGTEFVLTPPMKRSIAVIFAMNAV